MSEKLLPDGQTNSPGTAGAAQAAAGAASPGTAGGAQGAGSASPSTAGVVQPAAGSASPGTAGPAVAPAGAGSASDPGSALPADAGSATDPGSALPVNAGSASAPGAVTPASPDLPDSPENYVQTGAQALSDAQKLQAQANIGVGETAASINAADAKPTPIDTDLVGLVDSADSNGLKNLTFANLWAWAKAKIEGAAFSYLKAVGYLVAEGGIGALRVQTTTTTIGYSVGRSSGTGLLTFKGDQAGFTGYDFLDSDGTKHFRITGGGDIEVGSGSLTFDANSGTWDGATMAGPQTLSGQLELTGQAATTDSSAVNVELSERLKAFHTNVNIHPPFSVASSGTGSSAILNAYGLSYPDLDPGTAAGGYAQARMSVDGLGMKSGGGVNFDRPFIISGGFGMGAWGAGAETVCRFLISCEYNPLALSDQDAFTDRGVGLEIGLSGSSTVQARIIYHDGTTYKQGSWVEIYGSVNTFNTYFSFAIENRGSGNFDLYLDDSGSNATPPSLAGSAAISTISDGPTGISGSTKNDIYWNVCNDSSTYTSLLEQFRPFPIRIMGALDQ